jgi:hypothetical protein
MIQVSVLTRVTAIVFAASICWPLGSAARGDVVSAEPAIAPLDSLQVVNPYFVRGARIVASPARHGFMPMFVGTNAPSWYARKAAARYNRMAPYNPHPFAFAAGDSSQTPPVAISFAGMADSASICPYYNGCQPPDQALAASSSWIVQGVNTSFAVYNASGALQAGWPKTAQSFFNVANPGSCDPNGPFLEDPRAFYDPVGQRFWVAALQLEGAFGLNSCPEKSTLWVAVSKTSDPRGAWSVYAFNMRHGTTNAADFAQIGLDAQAFYFGANMFDVGGIAFQYDEVFAADKSAMQAGTAVVARGLRNITVGTTLIDTLQPVLVEGAPPGAGMFVSSANINSGGGNCASGCTGIDVFAMANPLSAPSLTEQPASTSTYSLAPLADEPHCMACIETFDTRISATPVYAGGLISFALETAVSSGSSSVPGVMWGQIKPTLNGQSIVGATTTQSGLMSFSGDQAASFGAMMPDASNNLIMVFDTMSAAIHPGIEYAGRLNTDPPGKFSLPLFLKHGQANTVDSRWGDYEATGYEGTATNRIWVASQYAEPNGDWGTYLGAVHF